MARTGANSSLNKSQPARRGRPNTPAPKTLKDLRLAAGLTLAEMEDRSGLPASILSQVERGRQSIVPAAADRIAIALGLPAGSLVARTMLVYEERSTTA